MSYYFGSSTIYCYNGESFDDYDYNDDADDEIGRHCNLLLWQWLILVVQIPLLGFCLCCIYRLQQSSSDVLPSYISSGLITGDGLAVAETECYDKDDDDQDDLDEMRRLDTVNNANDEDYYDDDIDDKNSIDSVHDNNNDDVGIGFDLSQDLAHTITVVLDAALDVALDVDEI